VLSPRLKELDALRGLAAVGIVAYHFSYQTSLCDRALYAAVNSLELFFVLSGYLITTIILDALGSPGFLRAFWGRRILRIWPGYFAVVGFWTLAAVLRRGLGRLDLLGYTLTFTQGLPFYWGGEYEPVTLGTSALWSVAVEEQFYIIWPLAIAFLGRRAVIPLALTWIVAAPVARAAGFNTFLLLTRADGFAIGGLLAWALRTFAASPGRLRSVFSALLIGALAFDVWSSESVGIPWFDASFPQLAPLHSTAACLASAALIGLVVLWSGSRLAAPLRVRWLVYLGKISYGIYLYHLSAMLFADRAANRFGMPLWVSRGLVAPALTLGVAAASWKWLESPILRLKNRFRYGSTSEPGMSGAVHRDMPAQASLPVEEFANGQAREVGH
jgi:peptidoglycan/LPS O-acetylase OafA/YrhL